jgi:8-oxo-dGTP pyrophosphatase MutT (NUDIX family)
VASGVLFVDDQDRVLMLRTTYKSHWEIPGGYVEATESPLDACVREVREEIGLDVDVKSLLAIDWAPHPAEGDKVLLVFDGGVLSEDKLAGINFVDGEIAEWAFVDADELDQLTIPRLARRIRQALLARQQGRILYLQDGAIPS